MNTPTIDNAGVRFPPPLLSVLAILAGWLLDRQWPLPIASQGRSATQLALGWIVILAAFALAFWAISTFRRWKTAVIPRKPATRIVQDGPFAYSRNPMYVGMTMLTVGVGVLLNTWWVLAMTPVALTVLYLKVVRREEAYLASTFPDDYRAYCARVRRWF